MKAINQRFDFYSLFDPAKNLYKVDPRIPELHKELADAKILP